MGKLALDEKLITVYFADMKKNNPLPLLLAVLFSTAALALPSARMDTLPPPNSVPLSLLSLEPAPSFHKGRFWLVTGSGAAIYSGLSVALWHAWYKGYPLTSFHTFDDWGEWKNLDKAGHTFSAYIACNYAFQGARWTGMQRRSAMWTAMGVGMLLQSTVEVMDGFSEEWGFSVPDMAFNIVGVGLFASQELLWKEQRILMKASGIRPAYPKDPLYATDGTAVTTLDQRAAELYGSSPFHVILKDYNALTVWASVNVGSFLKNTNLHKFPPWLNLAIGYGAGNIYGGFENKWTTADGAVFVLDPVQYPRYQQFFLSPDIDFSKIPVRSRWAKFALGILNWVKLPAPALEVNSLGRTRFHYIYW